MIARRLSGLSAPGLAAVMFVLVFGGTCVVVGVFYQQTLKFRLASMRDRVGELANVAVAQVEVELHERLVSTDQFESPEHRRALAPLVQMHLRQPAIDYLFTVRETNGKEFIVLETAHDAAVVKQQRLHGKTPAPTGFLQQYQAPANSAEARATLRAGKVFVFPEPYTDPLGTFIEARAPLINKAGEYVGYLGVDYSLELLVERIRQVRWAAGTALLLGLVMSLVLTRLTYRTRRQLIETLEQLRAAEAVAREQRDIATAASNAKSELLAIATHDFKNPLSAIAGMSGLMLQEKRALPASPEVREDILTLETIHASAKHLAEIVRGVLMNEGLEQGGLPFEPVAADLSALAEKIVRFNAASAKKKGIVVESRISPNIIVKADPKLLHEAFDNYLSNAIKYSPRDQVVTVSLAELPDGTGVEFAVRDAGPGLSVEDQAKLFRKFQKLTARPTGGETSTGLGLSIVKTIAELHRGSVGCESELGHGARFWLRLPSGPVPPPTPEGPRA